MTYEQIFDIVNDTDPNQRFTVTQTHEIVTGKFTRPFRKFYEEDNIWQFEGDEENVGEKTKVIVGEYVSSIVPLNN